MIENFIKIAIRNILKHKGFAFINIFGLAIGIACSILILLFVTYELSYDKFHEKADRIYRIAVRAMIGDTKIKQTYSSAITFQKLLEDFPEIETGVKIYNVGRTPVVVGEETFYESRFLAVDSTFFDIFSIPLLHGNKDKVLSGPNTMVISKSTALRYFNEIDVVGKNIQIDFTSLGNGIKNLLITGVSDDVPNNSHFHYDLLMSLMTFPKRINSTGWYNNNFQSYVVLKEGASKVALEDKFSDFTRKYNGGEDFDKWVAKGNFWEYFLQPITEIHLTSDLNGEFEANGNGTYVNIFSVISIFILLVACINFMNLSTAKSSLRAKEVGMKKVVGSGRGLLMLQFLSESIIISFIALAFGLIIMHLLLPAYTNLVDRPLHINYFDNYFIIPALLGMTLIIGIFSGAYPAFVLSSFKPISVLKSGTGKIAGNSRLRNSLVVFQFGISIFLIIGTITVYKQLEFFQNKKLGFDKERILVVNNPGSLVEKVDAFKDELRKYRSITDVSGSNMLPGKSFSNIGFGAEGVEESFTLNIGICDYEFANTLKLDIEKGRFFTPEFISDSSAVVINESTMELLGWDDPLGKKINNWSSNRGNFTVIGVVKDFHYESLHQEIRPMALFLEGGYYKRVQNKISIKLNSDDIQETVTHIENTWKEFVPGSPFEYSFLDQDFDNLYANESQTKKTFTIFSILSIFIACLGLFGLASFIAERRTKEIGIRKVMGASVSSIINILNRGFVKWVAIASLIASPIAWYAMENWLQNFAYRIELSVWMFVFAAGLALVIALIIVSFQTVRAALKNPVDSLQYE